jgi:methanethiol S-methyltransferase
MKEKIKLFLSSKSIFFIVGLVNVFVFHYSIYRLWFFLYGDHKNGVSHLNYGWITNTILVVFFTIPHSLLLNTSIKKWFLRFIPQKLYSTFYGMHAGLALIMMDKFWVKQGVMLVDFGPSQITLIKILYITCWVAIFWTMFTLGLFKQSGIEEWWGTLKGHKAKMGLPTRGPFAYSRHPIYLSFMGMIWFTPHYTIDRLYLSLSWTLYIIVGMAIKERRLSRNKGYRNYSKQVPLIPFLSKKIDSTITSKIWGKS